jgi:hypothetical protein
MKKKNKKKQKKKQKQNEKKYLHCRNDKCSSMLLSSSSSCSLFLSLHKRNQVCDCLLHDSSTLDDLRQKHLTSAEQTTNLSHTSHQRTFNHMQRTSMSLAGLFDISFNVISDTLDKGVAQALRNGLGSPFFLLLLFLFAFLRRERAKQHCEKKKKNKNKTKQNKKT